MKYKRIASSIKNRKYSGSFKRALLSAVLLTGAFCVPGFTRAAEQTAPLTVTDKDQVISDDFNVNPVPDNFSVIKADSTVSGGTITINSKRLHAEGENMSSLSKNALIRTTGSSVYGESGFNVSNVGLTPGYEGTLNLADGMTINGYVKGNGTSTMGIYEEGYDKLGTVVNTVTRPRYHRDVYTNNNGKPAGVTVNVGKNTKIALTGIQLPNQSGSVEDRYFRNFAICNDGGTLNVGDGSSLSATAYGRYAVTPAALYNSKYGVTNLGNDVTLAAKGVLTEKTAGNGAEVYGLISRHDHVGDDESDVIGRQTVTAGDNLTINADLSCKDIDYKKPYSLAVIAAEIVNTNLTTGKNTKLHTTQDDKGLGTYALFANKESTATFGDGFQANVEAKGTTYGVFGLYAQRGSAITLQGKAATTVQAAGNHQAFGTALYGSTLTAQGPYTIQVNSKGYNTQTIGLYLEKDPNSGNTSTVDTTGGKLTIGLDVQGDAVKDPGYYNQETTQYVSDTAHLNTLANDGGTAALGAADLSLAYKGNMTEKTEVRGVGTLSGGTTTAHGPVNVTVAAENTGTKAATQLVYGLANTGSTVDLKGSVTANVTAKNVGEAYGVRTTDKGTTTLGDGTAITLSSDADNSAVVKSEDGGITTFNGGAVLGGVAAALYSTGSGSQISLEKAGAKTISGDLLAEDNGAIRIGDEGLRTITGDLAAKGGGSISVDGKGTSVITGNLLSQDKGSINLELSGMESVLTGKSTVDGGTTNVAVTDGGLWNMTGSSTVTGLTLSSAGRVNMEANKDYQTLTADTFQGQGGTFFMKTDLASQTKGDKVYMSAAGVGSSGFVQVSDASLTDGQEVTGVKNLLLITDASRNATFTGKSLDKGGLWDVTPTIRRGDTVKDGAGNIVGKDTEWYLTKVAKKVNPSTHTVIHSIDNTYAFYRNSIDTLRQRMGDFRFRDKKEDVSGLWARDTHGAYSGDGISSRYNRLQLGYDYAANRKSIYGFLFERGIGNPSYENGHGKDHTFAGALYGTWLGDNGSYTDVAAKVGRDDSTLHSYGQYPDSASFRSREESLSVEYGRTHTLNDKGLFLEPQAQIVFGHLDSKDYTTSRGKTVHMDSYNSAIGRIGLLLGQRKTEGNHPFDYYAKVSLLHEFGGDRDFHFTAPDGEIMDTSEDYRDTWYEAGFGGTYRVNKNTYLYADGEREFGGKWNRKWQWNVGIHWQF